MKPENGERYWNMKLPKEGLKPKRLEDLRVLKFRNQLSADAQA